MPAIVIVDGSEPILAAARASALALGDDLRELPSVRDAVAVAADSGPETEVFVFGAAVDEPIQGVQQLHVIAPETPVLVLAEPGAEQAVTRALQFSPFVSSFVRCAPSEAAKIGRELERAVREYRQRRKHKATLAALNQQLSAPSESPPQGSATEYLGRLLDVAPIGVVTTDLAGSITACNREATALLEISERDALGTKIAERFEALPDAAWGKLAAEAARGRLECVLQRRRRDGGAVQLHTILASVPSRGGPAGVLVVLQDVTARREAERQRDEVLVRERAARAEAEAANRSKDEFLSIVSHEMRTPLTSILGWTQMLRRSEMTPERRTHGIEVIHRNALAQAALVEDLLDVSRIVTGKLRLDIRRIEPAEVVETAVATVQAAADAKRIRVETAIDPDVGPFLGDATRLQQIVWNLLSNAVKFTPPGGKVRVVARRFESSLELTVTDDGQGISPDFLRHVFEPFRQQDATTTRAQGGLGLGLAIVRHLVELHGGTIRAESAGASRGATFTVRLPILALRDDAQERLGRAAKPIAPAAARLGADLEGLRILVVDDEADAREMIAGFLESRRATVETAASAAEALEKFRRNPPNLVLADIGMPGEDGYSLVRRIREIDLRVPVVALSAFARAEDRAHSLRAGFDLHLTKPVDVLELSAVLFRLARASEKH